MSKKNLSKGNQKEISRRNFLRAGGVLAAGSVLTANAPEKLVAQEKPENSDGRIIRHRLLGRTGFKVSDISMGCIRVREPNVIRYAYDKGINYFDTAEGYGNGDSERTIGAAMKFMDREKIFVTTKLHVEEGESQASILERFDKCQKRLQTDYIDCLYMHSVKNLVTVNHAGFHGAVKKLKSEQRLRHAGISSHGSHRQKDDSMETVLTAAAEDGRFDVMLFIYNIMNKEAAEKILGACKKNNVGTTAMKITPGVVKVDPVIPDNLTDRQQRNLDRYMGRGQSREEAIQRLKANAEDQQKRIKDYQPFLDKYGIKTEEQMRKAVIQWVLKNPDMHTICYTFTDFDLLDQLVPLSGTELSMKDKQMLNEYIGYNNDQYCRHGCQDCLSSCPQELPVSKIMRYAYYFDCHGREKLAMEKYASLNGHDGRICLDCDAPCSNACPHQFNIQAQLNQAHSMLSLV